MRINTIKMVHAVASWFGRILAARLPMDVIYGLRTR